MTLYSVASNHRNTSMGFPVCSHKAWNCINVLYCKIFHLDITAHLLLVALDVMATSTVANRKNNHWHSRPDKSMTKWRQVISSGWMICDYRWELIRFHDTNARIVSVYQSDSLLIPLSPDQLSGSEKKFCFFFLHVFGVNAASGSSSLYGALCEPPLQCPSTPIPHPTL